ncbi:MAG: efflux RND transporter permease subunit, partial [Vulcanimicrobiaceae bacterium]
PEVRRGIASFLIERMQQERGVVDVYPSDKALPASLQLEVDQREASLAGTNAADIAAVLAMSLHGASVSTLHTADDPRPVGIFLRFAPEYRNSAAALASIQIPTRSGGMVPLFAVTHLVAAQAQAPLYRDDFENVSYVGADMAGRSSTYAVIDMLFALARHPLSPGYRVFWDGEWYLTNTVFADLGRAMGVAFLLIYFVLVARFRSFMIPLVVLAAVPLAVIGVMPGFALLAPFGVYFSATAMIGLIALIGIVVRNSIILIEFIEDKRKQGSALHEALIEATTTRTRPIFLTAAAGVLSSIVIASDPVWSGLAWALVFGMTSSAVLSVLAIPLLYERVVRKAASAAAPRDGAPAGLRLPGVPFALRTFVTFPELGGFVMESTSLPRVFEGEFVQLDAEVFRGEGDAVDAVAKLSGPYRVERASVDFSGAFGELQGRQHVTLRSTQIPGPAWRLLEYA